MAMDEGMKVAWWVVLGMTLVQIAFGRASPHENEGSNTPAAPSQRESNARKLQAQRYRLEWNRKTLVGDYERFGRRNPKWDVSAKLALESFAQFRSASEQELQTLQRGLVEKVKAAVADGCDDPLIRYCHVRYILSAGRTNLTECVPDFRPIADALLSDPRRAVIRKYYAAMRGTDMSDLHPLPRQPADRQMMAKARQCLLELVKDKDTPPGELYEAWDLWLHSISEDNSEHYMPFRSAERMLVTNWPSEACFYLLKGRVELDWAWKARGGDYAHTVSAREWQLFSNRLVVVEQALDKAWELDSTDARIPSLMITLELGQGRGRERMERWFSRAMALNTNYYEACCSKLNYLQPKWYGSPRDSFEFAWECVRSEKWGGRVPLIMLQAHEWATENLEPSQAASYWKKPEVWQDVKAAFEKFARINPQVTSWHNGYARYAYRAEQWADLNRELKLLGPVNYGYFGGKEEFDKMVRLAREHQAKPE
jgi:hypothetical protein